jgi:predicted ATPase
MRPWKMGGEGAGRRSDLVLNWAPMAVQRITLRDFTAFEEIELELCVGINVFLGENGTGKTHVLKAIYAALRAAERLDHPTLPGVSTGFDEGLVEIFRPAHNDVERLRRIGIRGRPEPRHLALETERYECHCELGHLLFVTFKEPRTKPAPEPVFMPSRDVLALYEGFVGAYQSRALSFDRTYFDVCVALDTPPLRDVPRVVEHIDVLAGGAFLQQEGRFELVGGASEDKYVGPKPLRVRQTPNLEAHLVGEGLRRLGTLGCLLRNGWIKPGMTLLWDEPEAGLNPRLITPLAGILVELAHWGVQVVLTTHDYLLPRHISRHAEYNQSPEIPLRFHGFYRPRPSSPVVVETAETLAGLEHNPILDEFTRHHERERELFYGIERKGEALP